MRERRQSAEAVERPPFPLDAPGTTGTTPAGPAHRGEALVDVAWTASSLDLAVCCPSERARSLAMWLNQDASAESDARKAQSRSSASAW